jgi:hypothetical protein
MIIEYKMHMTAGGMRTPEWVEDGGYFVDDATNTKVGWSPDEANREYYVPDSVTTMTEAELKTKLLAMHETTKFQKMGDDGEMADMTNAEVNTMAADWVSARS